MILLKTRLEKSITAIRLGRTAVALLLASAQAAPKPQPAFEVTSVNV